MLSDDDYDDFDGEDEHFYERHCRPHSYALNQSQAHAFEDPSDDLVEIPVPLTEGVNSSEYDSTQYEAGDGSRTSPNAMSSASTKSANLDLILGEEYEQVNPLIADYLAGRYSLWIMNFYYVFVPLCVSGYVCVVMI